MTNKTRLFALMLVLLALMLAACKADQEATPAEGPENAYWAYYQACQDERFETAAMYLTETARERANDIGVCGFTHDAINDLIVAQGGTIRTFSEDPEVFIDDGSAALTWFDDQGNLANVSLTKTEEGWKISEALWSN